MKPVVINDPDLQLSAVVDTETFTAWGPAMFGPDGQRLIGAWLETLPADPSGLPSDVALAWFVNWLDASGQMPGGDAQALQEAATADPGAPDAGTVSLAEYEAQNAGDGPPPPQPTDADPTAAAPASPAEPSDTSATAGTGGQEGGIKSEPAPAAPDGPPSDRAPIATAPATATVPCSTCQGTGVLTFDGEDGPVSSTCAICQGTGKVLVEA